MKYFKTVSDGYVVSYGIGSGAVEIAKAEYESIKKVASLSPIAPSGYSYKLRADTLKWELVELPPEPEPTNEEALTRYANELTGSTAETLQEATENLIKHFKEE